MVVAWHFVATGASQRDEYRCDFCIGERLYETRNCHRHFPDRVDDRREPWIPHCRTDKGTPFVVERDAKGRAYQVSECPRSATSDHAIELVLLVSQQLQMHEATGSAMIPGADIGKWPQRWFEAVSVVYARRNMRQRAEMEALSKD